MRDAGAAAAAGFSFANVRLHRDAHAEALAEASHARAVTIGSDIYFGRGEYAPHTTRGRELIAHELIHVAQAERQGMSAAAQYQPHAFVNAAEREARTLAPQVARGGWSGVNVMQPAAPLMRDALPEQDLSEDRDAIRMELLTRYPWLLKLSNREAVEHELVARIALERRVVSIRTALSKLPDPQATILSDEIERRNRLRAPVEKKLGRAMAERDKHAIWVKIDPMQLVSPQMWAEAGTSAGVVAMLRELKKYPAWVVLHRSGLDAFRYGVDVRLDGAWLPMAAEGIHRIAFFRAGLVEPMLSIQAAFHSATAEQMSDLMRQWVDLDPLIAERELEAYVAEGDAAELEPTRELSADEQQIADYQAANKQYAEAVRQKTQQAVAPLILIASFFEIGGPVDLLLTIVPVEKVGAKLYKAGRRALDARKARKLEQALIKEFESHLGDEAREFLKLARGLSKAEVRAVKTIHEVLRSPGLVQELMRRAGKTANLEWIAKKLESKELDRNFVRSFTRAKSNPSWKTLEDIVEKRKVARETRESLASKMTGLLGEEAAEKLVRTGAFREFALGAKSTSKIKSVVREVSYGGKNSLDLVALTDRAELVFGEVKHWSTSTWLTDGARLLKQLDDHNAGITQIAKQLSRRASDVKKKVVFVSREGFMGLEMAKRIELIEGMQRKGWHLQLLENTNIETFGNLIDRLR